MRPRGRRVPDGQLRPAALSTLAKLLAGAGLLYGGLVAAAWALQERLLFYPQRSAGPLGPPAGWRAEPIAFPAAQDVTLAGVLAIPPGPPAPLVIYFGGNAEEVTSYLPWAEREWGRRAVLLVNYRGYGASQGEPTERALVADALALYDAMATRGDVDGTRIAVHGRSLGSGVAAQVAAARRPRCVVLTTPLASALDVARVAYPWLPVALLMRHRFDAAAAAPRASSPALVVIGEADTLIPPAHSERLAAAWGGPVEVLRLPGRGHGDVQDDPRYAPVLHAFLDRHH